MAGTSRPTACSCSIRTVRAIRSYSTRVSNSTARRWTPTSPGTASFVHFPLTVRAPVQPVADFAAVPTTGQAPLTVNFTNTSTSDFVFADWNFTNQGTFFNINSATGPVEHTYTTPGVYSVRMRARAVSALRTS